MSIRMSWGLVCRSRFLLIIMVLFVAGITQAQVAAGGCTGVSPSTTGSVTWNPQWCQEFSGAAGSSPDTSVWSFDLGNNNGWGNNELEVYCGPTGYAGNPSGCPGGTITSNPVYVDGSGHLVIQAINSGGTWYSTRMKTEGLENFQYGRIEASIQLPDTSNQGLWPAFWSLGSNINTTPWPACGETDFMEVWSPQVDSGPGPGGNRTTIHTAATDGSGVQPNGAYTFSSGANDTAFHTYGMIWSANMQQFYIDNPLQPYYITTPNNLSSGDTWPFNAQIFLIANIAVGGTLGGTPSSSTPNPATMMLDYVRQYQPSAVVPAPAMGTPPAITLTAGATTGNSSTFPPGLTADTGYVYFSCTTNAPKASCAIKTTDPLNQYVANSSSSVSPAETVTVSVTTTANTSSSSTTTAGLMPLPFSFNPKMRLLLPVMVMGFLVSAVVIPVPRRGKRKLLYACALIAGLILTGAATWSCGGGNNGGGNQITPPNNNGTTPGSYTVTVYAFTESNVGSGSNSTADANVVIPLTVN